MHRFQSGSTKQQHICTAKAGTQQPGEIIKSENLSRSQISGQASNFRHLYILSGSCPPCPIGELDSTMNYERYWKATLNWTEYGFDCMDGQAGTMYDNTGLRGYLQKFQIHAVLAAYSTSALLYHTARDNRPEAVQKKRCEKCCRGPQARHNFPLYSDTPFFVRTQEFSRFHSQK